MRIYLDCRLLDGTDVLLLQRAGPLFSLLPTALDAARRVFPHSEITILFSSEARTGSSASPCGSSLRKELALASSQPGISLHPCDAAPSAHETRWQNVARLAASMALQEPPSCPPPSSPGHSLAPPHGTEAGSSSASGSHGTSSLATCSSGVTCNENAAPAVLLLLPTAGVVSHNLLEAVIAAYTPDSLALSADVLHHNMHPTSMLVPPADLRPVATGEYILSQSIRPVFPTLAQDAVFRADADIFPPRPLCGSQEFPILHYATGGIVAAASPESLDAFAHSPERWRAVSSRSCTDAHPAYRQAFLSWRMPL